MMRASDQSDTLVTNATSRPVRLFVALETNDGIKRTLASARAALQRDGEIPVRWAAPEKSHCTLVFLGDVLQVVVPSLKTSLRLVAAQHRPLALQTDAIRAFPSMERPRTLWVGITGDLGALAALQHAVTDAVRILPGMTLDRKPYQPHLTLGRVHETVRDPVARRSNTTALQRKIEVPSAIWSVHEIALIESVLGPGGARYTVHERFPLGMEDGSR